MNEDGKWKEEIAREQFILERKFEEEDIQTGDSVLVKNFWKNWTHLESYDFKFYNKYKCCFQRMVGCKASY